MDLGRRTDLAPQERALMAQRLQIFLLDAIAASSASKGPGFMFHGGTAISTCYGSPRWSEDLDFVIDPARLDAIDAALDAARGTIGGRVEDVTPGADIRLESRGTGRAAEPGTVSRWLLRWEHPARVGAVKVKAEFFIAPPGTAVDYMTRPAHPAFDLDRSRHPLPVATPEGFRADKIMAVSARPAMKWRDIFDLGFVSGLLPDATRSGGGLMDRLRVAATSYRGSLPEIREGLDRPHVIEAEHDEDGFISDMQRWIPTASFEALRSSGELHEGFIAARDQMRIARETLDREIGCEAASCGF